MMLGRNEVKVWKMLQVTVRVHACGYLDEAVHAGELSILLAQCPLLRMRGYCVNALLLLARYKGFEGMCASMEWNDMDASLAYEKCMLLASEFVFLTPERWSRLAV